MGNSNDPIKFLINLNKKINYVTSGKHGNAGLTVFARLVLIFIVLGFAGPILGHALMTMPAGLVVIIMLGLALRLMLWYFKRSH